ncbi:MAG: SWIB/MDM2 domain-containing protein [Waddliaceae bacterium]
MTTTKRKKPQAFSKPVNVSEELAKVVGKGPLARTEVTKRLWDYIKKNKLQDEKNRRNINPDSQLSPILGNEPIDMFKMTSKVSKHLSE